MSQHGRVSAQEGVLLDQSEKCRGVLLITQQQVYNWFKFKPADWSEVKPADVSKFKFSNLSSADWFKFSYLVQMEFH